MALHDLLLRNGTGGGLLPSAIGVLVLVLLVRHIALLLRDRQRARKLGCRPAPVLSNGFPFGVPQMRALLRADDEHRFPQHLQARNAEIKRRFGRHTQTVDSYMLGARQIFTTDPVNVRAILAAQFKEFGLGKDRNNCLALLQGYGVFSSDGAQWEHSRAMLRPQFTREQIDDLSLQAKHMKLFMQAVDTHLGPERWTHTFDIQQLFFRFTMDSSTEFLLGESIDSQLRAVNPSAVHHDIEFDEQGFIEAFDASLDHMTRGLRLGPYYWLAQTKEAKRVCKVVQDFMDVYVKAALTRHAAGEKVDGGGERKKQRYVLADALCEETQDPIEIRNQLLNILIAGRDTTASLLGWLFLLLARHPEEYRKLHAAILESFGSYTAPVNLDHSGLRACAPLQHCLNEALRLFPLVPINFRKCLVPFTTIPRGGGPAGTDPVYVREGEDVFYTTVNMHRDPDFWGPDADVFRPTRWDGLRPGWQFLPFNGGPRVCLGQQFAINQASYVVVRLLQRFDAIEGVDLPAPGQELHHLTVTDACATPVKVRLRSAQV